MNSVTIIIAMSILAIVTAVVYTLKVTSIKVGTLGGNEKKRKAFRNFIRYLRRSYGLSRKGI